MPQTRTYYEILGLPRTASTADIKKRYRELVRRHHPDVTADKAAGEKAFVQITEAYKTLVDPAKRRAYDAPLTHVTRRLGEAAELCNQAITRDRSAWRAPAILGDIYRLPRRYGQAMIEYGYAVQF